PAWVNKMNIWLTDVVYGDLWEEAKSALLSLEASTKFKTTLKALPSSKRPQAVSDWVHSGRTDTLPACLCNDGDVVKLEKDVLTWWNKLQPSWRKLTEEELPTRAWSQEVKGSWEVLACPGVNGLYSVMACLQWWMILLPSVDGDSDAAPEAWKDLIKDLVFVIDSVAEEHQCPASKKARIEDEDDV
ncbi:hypothetical protein K435DRAFT_692084, partial [Dendrothele bispora CBS 962.96]